MPVQRRVVAVVGVAAVAIAGLTVAATATSDRVGDAQRSRATSTTTTAPRRAPGERTAPADVDGDGTSDLVLYRPGTGSFWVQRSRDGQVAVALGEPGDVPTIGDFDGDGRADLAVVTPGVGTRTGSWTIRSSADGKVRTIGFGLAGDVAVPGDYDGDGIDDVAVYRPPAASADDEGQVDDEARATWFVRRSSAADPTELLVVPFGLAGDQPAPADYDGDGTTDLAVQRVDTRWIEHAADGRTEAVAWGQAWDQPVVLDRDGDGRAEVAVLRQEDGALRWYLKPERADDEATVLEFGRAVEPDQQPLVGDFDGDGRTEPAVFEPGTGSFWIWQPDGARVETWGEPGDVALP